VCVCVYMYVCVSVSVDIDTYHPEKRTCMRATKPIIYIQYATISKAKRSFKSAQKQRKKGSSLTLSRKLVSAPFSIKYLQQSVAACAGEHRAAQCKGVLPF